MRNLVILGTDTGVGKTAVTLLLAQGLRALGQRVWLHKPVACGGWDGVSAEDGRALRTACGDGQDPATVCPREYPEACSPHLAAEAAGATVSLADLLGAVRACETANREPRTANLLLETAGGLLAPLTAAREDNADLCVALAWPAILVTRPHLGTLNHTRLTVHECRRRGIRLLGLVLNRHEPLGPSLAVDRAAAELAVLTGLPVLAELPFRPCGDDGLRLARAVQAII